MRCRRCRKKDTEITLEGLKFCTECFSIYFENQFQKAIEGKGLGEKMAFKQDRIAVAVSGGKDSMTCLYLFKKYGFNVEGIHLNLGFGEISQKAERLIKDFAKKHKFKIIIINTKKDLGIDLPSIFKKHKNKKICGICGTIKRYLLNKIAIEKGFTVLATGHNLDDGCSVLLKSLLVWDVEGLARHFPILPSRNQKLIKKIKPLFRVTDKEIKKYAEIMKIDHLEETCPYAKGRVTLFKTKEILEDINKKFPGFKRQFYFGFLENKKLFKRPEPKLNECKICRMLTTNPDMCAFCKLIKN